MTTVRAAGAYIEALVMQLGWRLATAMGLAMAVACVEGTGVLLLIPLLGSIGLAPSDNVTSGLALNIERAFAVVGLTPNLYTVLGAFLVVSGAHALLYRAHLVAGPSLEQEFNLALRRRITAAVMRADWSFLTRNRMADLVHATTHEVDQASGVAYHLFSLFSGAIVSAVYVTIAFRLSPLLTVAVSIAGLGVLWMLRHGARRGTELGETHREATERQFEMVSESFNGLKVTRTLGAETRNLEALDRLARLRADSYLDLLRLFGWSRVRLDMSSALLVSVLLIVAVQGMGLSGTGLVMLIVIFSRVMPRVLTLQSAVQIVTSNLPSYIRVAALIEDLEQHADTRTQEGPALQVTGDVHFDSVSYAYTPGGRLALNQVSLALPAGRITAIVGRSGAGKSTLADLIIGLLRPLGGTISIDGRELAPHEIARWRWKVGYVPQDGFLFHATVRENLRWAKPDATDAEMWRALEQAAAAGFLRSRPEGLDTIVGDRGIRLSGGERQRLALARALLTNPDVLVLDEATSMLDTVNEDAIIEAVRRLRGRVTVLIITHRLSAIRHADVIHVLEAGRIIESGSWAELIARGGAFANLLRSQADEGATLAIA
jgi:ATP-binding cassette subfamily C protein